MNDYRNPFIVETMKVLGYVNRFSRGVYRVQKELEENGNAQASFDYSFSGSGECFSERVGSI